MIEIQKRPKVAFAFSGASSRSIFYVGFLEALQEQQFPIDFIASMSGAAVVSGSFACGTLKEVKEMALGLNTELVYSLIERSKGSGGLYQLTKVEEYLRTFTKNKNFDEVSPKLAIVASDIVSGQEVALQVGDIAKAISASCALPGVFKPVPWGNKSLVDGGLLSIVPGNIAAAFGADLVIGVDLRGTRHVFSPWQIFGKRVLNKIKSILWPHTIQALWTRVHSSITDETDFFHSYSKIDTDLRKVQPKLWTVLGRSLDLAIEAQEKSKDESDFGCDMLIVPDLSKKQMFWKKYLFLHFTDFSHTKEYYQLGRDTAELHLPRMWQLLADTKIKEEQADKKITKILSS